MTIPIPTLRFPTLWLIEIFVGLTVALPGRLAAEEPALQLPAEAVCLGDLYAGTLDNHLAIRLSLVRQGEQLDGAIYYEKDERYDTATNRYQSLRLEGKVDKDGRFVLTESDPGKEAESRVTGRFAGAFDAEGKASGTWETPAGDQKLSFHVNPTNSLEQGRNPRYRLRFEPARVWLSIEGGQETLLTGPDNEAASPCFPSEQFLEHENRLNPESMHVRKLNGQPDLYWMSYELKSQDWRGYQADRRHRVVRAGNPEQSLFDEWTEEGSKSGSGNVYADWSEDYVITYQGATLRIVNAKSYDSGFGDNEDCVTCVEEHENCPAFCEGFVCTLPGAESMERCEEVCLRNCERKDWVEECYAGKETQKPYLRKRIREIDVQTGLVKSDHRFQLNDFIPGWYRCSGKALHFFVLDDGISGWLLVRDQTLFGQNGETPKPTPFDPENPGQIPAIATCWLYNRVPWDNVNSTRLYPPAPPDQIRPDHFVPKHCCVIETSADGKRTLLYENLKAEQDEEKAGRLLAIFDGSLQNCYSANIAQDGRWGKAPFDWIGNPVFSPDGSKLGYRAKQGIRWFVVINDQRTPDFDLVSAPVFSPDGQHVAYWARQAKQEFIVRDDRKGLAFDGAGFPVFSPDGSKVAYRAREGNQWFVMRGDEKGPAFDDIGYYTVPDTGRGSDIADVVFSPDGRQLAYAARRGQQWFIVRDDRPGPAFEHVGLPVFGPDGQLAHRARRNDREFILLAGKKGPEFDFVGNPVFSVDGHQMAYWARQGKTEFIVHGERKALPFDQVGAPLFNRAGDQVIYWAKQGGKEFIMTGGKKGPKFDSIESPVLNPHTDQIAYRVRQSGKEFVMLGDQKGPEFDFDDSSRSRPLVFSPDGRQLAYRDRQDGKEFILLGENKGPSFDEVGEPVFSPDGGRLAYRAQLGTRWFPIVDSLKGPKPDVATRTIASPVVPLRKTVPSLIPHPVVVDDGTITIIGGATKKRWIGTETFTPPDLEGGSCRSLGPEWIPPGLSYRLYSFDKPLGECAGSAATVCIDGGSGEPFFTLDFPGCPVKKFRFAIAASWNALPRRPKVLQNHQDFTPLVRKFLDRKGLKQAPVRIEYVHGVDLDGDGIEERVIHARSSKDEPLNYSAWDYSVLLLVRTTQGKPETAVISGWWSGQENQGTYERYGSSYADANGDGVMEIFVDWLGYEESGIRTYTLRGGKPVEIELRFYEGV